MNLSEIEIENVSNMLLSKDRDNISLARQIISGIGFDYTLCLPMLKAYYFYYKPHISYAEALEGHNYSMHGFDRENFEVYFSYMWVCGGLFEFIIGEIRHKEKSLKAFFVTD